MGKDKKMKKNKPPVVVAKLPEQASTFDEFLDTLDSEDEELNEEENVDSSGDEEHTDSDGIEDDDEEIDGDEEQQTDSDGIEDDDDEEIDGDEDEDEVDTAERVDSDSADDDDNLENDNDDEEVEDEAPIKMNGSHNSNSNSESEDEDFAQNKQSLKNLEQLDPEFFAFLKENDAELLNFDDDDDSEDDEDGEDAVHKPPEELEVASDSEAEEELLDDEPSEHKHKIQKLMKKGQVNLHLIRDWEQKLTTTKDLTTFNNVVAAFDCAVQTIVQADEVSGLKWKVEGSSNFNALVRLCFKHIKGFCVRYLCGNNLELSLKMFDQRPFEVIEKSKQKWVRLRPKIKSYMQTIVMFLKSMGNTDAISSILRHLQKMSGFWAIMSTKSYKLMRSLISIWSQGEDSCRILAFVAIIRITNYNKDVFLLRIFRQMYMAYVTNCKFTSVNTWASINFMRTSLVEAYSLDSELAYNVAFPFIRQLAIHLRNAVTNGMSDQVKQSKKEASRIVYSWQFLHSLHMWVDLLAQSAHNSESEKTLKLLVYPVVQLCLGTIKLIQTKKYIPLRFHVIKMLINLQDKSKVFIPVLPLATEVLSLIDFSSKSVSKFSVRPLDLTCCLKAEASESGYAKAVSDSAFEAILGACKAVATELSFPEIVTPTLMKLKSFLKKVCKNPEVSRKFKSLIDKIEANANYVKDSRSKAMEKGTVTLADLKSHQILRLQMENAKSPPPLLAFAAEYFKTSATIAAKERRSIVTTREEKLIPKPSGPSKSSKKNKHHKDFDKPMFSIDDSESDGESEPFKTKFDADEDDEEETITAAKKRKLEKKKQKKEKVPKKKKKANLYDMSDFADDVQDDVVDFELSD